MKDIKITIKEDFSIQINYFINKSELQISILDEKYKFNGKLKKDFSSYIDTVFEGEKHTTNVSDSIIKIIFKDGDGNNIKLKKDLEEKSQFLIDGLSEILKDNNYLEKINENF